MTAFTGLVGSLSTDWTAEAACGDAPADLFHPGDGGIDDIYEAVPDYGPALAFCQACPVVNQCRRDAIARRDYHGVRGGLTPQQLGAEIARAVPHGTMSGYATGCRCDRCHRYFTSLTAHAV